MLPIPVQIIGSNKRFFIPLLYLVVTTVLCYLFLIALVDSSFQTKFSATVNTKSTKSVHLKSITNSHILLVSPTPLNSERLGLEDEHDHPTERFQRSVLSLRGKTYPSKKINNNYYKNGTTRRSTTAKIWSGYQDLWIDPLAPVHHPWPHSKQCKIFTIRFAKKNTFKPRALVSFPGSGNSWLRYLIECTTGIFTGSVYGDKSLLKSGLLGELRAPNDGSTIVQKTHHDTTFSSTTTSKGAKGLIKLSELVFGYRGILLIRNPYDAILSYWNYLQTRDHTRHAKEINSFDIKWTKHVTEKAEKWSTVIMTWVENSMDLLIVQYEELKKNPRQEIIRILKYLEQPVNWERLNCLLKKENLEGPFHRPRQHNNNKTSEQQGNSTESIHNTQESSFSVGKSIFSNNHQHPPLDLIIQNNIHKINLFFSQKAIPIQLNYSAPSFYTDDYTADTT